MRRAMREPVLLWARVELEGAAEVAGALEPALGGGEAWASPMEPGALWCLRRFPEGEAARAAWTALTGSAAWRALAPRVAAQPSVHLVAFGGRAWPLAPGAITLFEYTTDATLRTRDDRRGAGRPEAGLVAFEALPALERGWVLPVIGHPGRLVGAVEGVGAEAVGRVEQALLGAWGAPVEPTRAFAARMWGG